MAEEDSEKPPEHDGRLPLRSRTHVLGATTGHVAVHVVAGAGGTVMAFGDLVAARRVRICGQSDSEALRFY